MIFLSSAQEVPKINKFLSKDYNALPQNWDITQDCDGYIFVANTQGILIFNGFKWQMVTLPRNQKPRAVHLGKDCKVYTTGYEFFGFIDISDRDKPFYSSIADDSLSSSNQEFWNIFGNNENLIFQSFSDLYAYNYKEVKKLSTPTNIMLGNNIGENLFLPKIENGLYQIIDDKVIYIEPSSKLPQKSKIVGICPSDTIGTNVLATQFDGIYLLDENNLTKFSSPLNELLKASQINKILRLSSGDYAIGTILDGIIITHDFKSIKHHINKINGLSNNTVLSLFEDQNSNLWAGLDKGLNLIRLNDKNTYYYDSPGQLGSVFTSITYNNELYIGTNQGVFRKQTDGSFKIIDNSQGQVWSFAIINNELIFGHNSGTYLVSGEKAHNISDITGGWCMKVVNKNQILQSTYTGLVLIEKNKNSPTKKSRLINGDILIETFNLHQNILTGFHPIYGLCVLTISSDFSEIRDKKCINEIDGNPITDDVQLLDSPLGTIVSFVNNQYVFDNYKFRKITNDEFHNIEKDSAYIVQTNYYNAISQVSKIENVSNTKFNRPNDDSNNFLVGFDEGYILIPKNQNAIYTDNPLIGVDFFTINGVTTEHAITEINVFKAFENDINVQLQNLKLSNLGGAFQYKLENWADKWFDIPSDGKLNFVNLQNGSYNLYIKTSDQEIQSVFSFSIKPHWYESLSGAILYIFLAYLLYFLLNKRQKKHLRIQREKLQHEKELELESERIKAKNEELLRDVAYKNKMLANSTMTLIQKNEMLIKLKDVIMHESKGQVDKSQLRQKILHLIDKNINSDQDWELFENTFAAVHEDFLNNLKSQHPNLTAGELRLAAYIKMNLSSKEIAPLINISLRSIENKRYRLRLKMGISHDNNLKMYLQSM